jgi:hypothetical protein
VLSGPLARIVGGHQSGINPTAQKGAMMAMDEIADLADRSRAMSEFEFAIEWGSLTAAEQDEYIALMRQRTAHGEEVLEATEANIRVLQALLVLQVERAPGMTLTEAIGSGQIGVMEVIETIRSAEPDPMAQRRPGAG